MTTHTVKATIINKQRIGLELTTVCGCGPTLLTEAELEMVAAAGGPSSGGLGSGGGAGGGGGALGKTMRPL